MEDQPKTESTGLQGINEQPVIKTIISENGKALSDILMANITRVQSDPNYVNQAKEIRDNVRELVNLARVEIDMFREMRKVSTNK